MIEIVKVIIMMFNGKIDISFEATLAVYENNTIIPPK